VNVGCGVHGLEVREFRFAESEPESFLLLLCGVERRTIFVVFVCRITLITCSLFSITDKSGWHRCIQTL
jgi:hypothetical protein